MNSVEDILQVQFMHDRMMAQEESGDKSSVAWSRLSRITKVCIPFRHLANSEAQTGFDMEMRVADAGFCRCVAGY